jgi:PDZ domain-containing protein
MRRRSLATTLVFGLLVALVAVAVLAPVPYVTMKPGPTVNVLGTAGGRPIIDVSGHRTYRTSGQLRLVTVSVTNPDARISLVDAMAAWLDPKDAVYPRDVIYPPQQSAQDAEQESSAEMVNSQDTAIAAALTELGYHLTTQVEVLTVTKGSPADGRLRPHDRILRVNGTVMHDASQVSRAIQRTGAGQPASFVVRRGGRTRHVRITPRESTQKPRKAIIGVSVGTGYDFPFDVSVRLGQDIGGPSAGLMFSLGIYDTLTPGSLAGGSDIAGTGTIDRHGHVGAIGGIQQKIVAAASAGAKVFFVPPGNCTAARHADVAKDRIRLVKAPSMHSAVQSLRAYRADPHAHLPACG